MRTSKIYVGAKVFNKKNEEGEITKIITKSTGYVEVTYANEIVKKEMAFNLKNENGEPLKKSPKSTAPKAPTKEDKIQSEKASLLKVNSEYEREYNQVTESLLNGIQVENSFINSLIDAWFNAYLHGKAFSEKQAYYLAKFIIENNL